MIERARVIGELCYLRPMEREDLTDEYLSWVNDTSTNAYIQAAGFPVNKEMLVQYFEASQPPDAVLFAVCDEDPSAFWQCSFKQHRLGHSNGSLWPTAWG